MLTLYRKKGVLYAKCLLNLKRDIHFKNNIFKSGKQNEDLIEVDAVYKILQDNGNIKIYNGKKFVKFNLGDFSHLVLNNNYLVEEVVEPKVEVKKEELKVEEKKVVEQPKKEEQPQSKVEVKKEEPKVEEKKVVEQPKKEEVKEDNNNNKKNRHKNNNQNNQGEDK